MRNKDEIIREALPLLNSGMSVLQISKIITDVSYSTLSNYLGALAPRKPRLTNEEKVKILELFDQGYTTVDIESLLNRDNSNIGNFLKANGRQPKGKKNGLLKADEIEICSLYLNDKISTVDIGEMFSLSDRTIAKVLTDNGIELRSGGTQTKIVNHDYFENIDTEEKAYFLGLMISDGSVIQTDNKTNCISIELTEEDGYMVEWFEKAICNSNGRCFYNKEKRELSFRGASQKMSDDLAKYGVVPRKTLISYLPTITEELMPHLIRGVFDGDGTVYHKKSPSGIVFGFYGTERICNEIKQYLINKICVSDNKVFVKKDSNVSFVYFSKKDDVQNFYNLIYQDATIYLKRKKKKFIDHANIELTD